MGVWVAAQLLQATKSRTWTHRSLLKPWIHELLVILIVISPARMIKAPPPPFSGSEKYLASFKHDFTTFAHYYGFAYGLTSRRHVKIDATTTAQSVIAGGHTREQYDDALNAWYALKQSAKPLVVKGMINRAGSPSEAWMALEETFDPRSSWVLDKLLDELHDASLRPGESPYLLLECMEDTAARLALMGEPQTERTITSTFQKSFGGSLARCA